MNCNVSPSPCSRIEQIVRPSSGRTVPRRLRGRLRDIRWRHRHSYSGQPCSKISGQQQGQARFCAATQRRVATPQPRRSGRANRPDRLGPPAAGQVALGLAIVGLEFDVLVRKLRPKMRRFAFPQTQHGPQSVVGFGQATRLTAGPVRRRQSLRHGGREIERTAHVVVGPETVGSSRMASRKQARRRRPPVVSSTCQVRCAVAKSGRNSSAS